MKSRTSLHVTGILALCVCSVVSISGLAGCHEQGSAPADRKAITIDELERHAPGSKALRLLREASPASLRTPTVVFARVFEQRETVALWVEWLALKPSADAVGIRPTPHSEWRIYRLLKGELEQNRAHAARGFVLFTGGASVPWAPKAEEWLDIAPDIRAGRAEAALFKNNARISDTVPVEYIKGPTLTKEEGGVRHQGMCHASRWRRQAPAGVALAAKRNRGQRGAPRRR